MIAGGERQRRRLAVDAAARDPDVGRVVGANRGRDVARVEQPLAVGQHAHRRSAGEHDVDGALARRSRESARESPPSSGSRPRGPSQRADRVRLPRARHAPGHVGVLRVGEDEVSAVEVGAKGGQLLLQSRFHIMIARPLSPGSQVGIVGHPHECFTWNIVRQPTPVATATRCGEMGRLFRWRHLEFVGVDVRLAEDRRSTRRRPPDGPRRHRAFRRRLSTNRTAPACGRATRTRRDARPSSCRGERLACRLARRTPSTDSRAAAGLPACRGAWGGRRGRRCRRAGRRRPGRTRWGGSPRTREMWSVVAAGGDRLGPPRDERHADAALVQVALAAAQRAAGLKVLATPAPFAHGAVVAAEEHDRVLGDAQLAELGDHLAHRVVEVGDHAREGRLGVRLGTIVLVALERRLFELADEGFAPLGGRVEIGVRRAGR